ncbi:MAG: FG-GAP repeat domain-containing protein [Verrucomicrobiales bacterium]
MPPSSPSRRKPVSPRLRRSAGVWVGVALVAFSLGGYLLRRNPDAEAMRSQAGGAGEPRQPGGEMLSLKWRRAVVRERSGAAGRASAVSAVSLSAEADAAAVGHSPAQMQMALLDPEKAGWESEQLSDAASRQLGRLWHVIHAYESGKREPLPSVLHPDFAGESPQPGVLKEILREGPLVARVSEGVRSGGPLTGADFVVALERLATGEELGTSARPSFKIVGVAPGADHFATRVRVELRKTEGADRSQQVTSVWNIDWTREEPVPRLKGVAVESYEEVEFAGPGGRLFADCTESVMADAASYREQFLPDASHWSSRLGVLESSSYLGHTGLAVGDANGDLLDDLYVCDAGGLPNRLYLQKEDGTLEDVSGRSGTDWLESTSAALFLDLDNDGDQDLVLATVRMLLLLENGGRANFTLRGAHPGVARARSMAAADYDNDGDTDLYLCSYDVPDKASGFGNRGVVASVPIPYNDAENGSANMLLANQGAFSFVDVTQSSGLDENNNRFSFSAVWEDFDRDGDQDLYVANDFGRNNLYRNNGQGKFRDIADEAGVEDMASGMSASWGDCNRDGRADLYVGNMFSAAGNRVAFQRQFQGSRSEENLTGIKRMARGNSLFLGAEGDQFSDASESAGVTMGRWAWSSLFADLNNDGWLDLVVGNGFVTGRDPDDL